MHSTILTLSLKPCWLGRIVEFMSCVIQSVEIPPECGVHKYLFNADFFDAFETRIEESKRSALEIYLAMIARTPSWVACLMAVRNRAVAIAGLKNLGGVGPTDPAKPANAYQVGDRIGVFTVESIGHDEVVLTASDTHLITRCSVLKRSDGKQSSLVLSSVVHIHNTFGHAYMAVVGPVHKLVVRAMLATL
jgi:Protein of unknown function (DUF2867)